MPWSVSRWSCSNCSVFLHCFFEVLERFDKEAARAGGGVEDCFAQARINHR